VKLNVNVFKPFGFTDGSRKLCAVRSKPFTASFRTLINLARPPPLSMPPMLGLAVWRYLRTKPPNPIFLANFNGRKNDQEK
jgi:hypothetical protein